MLAGNPALGGRRCTVQIRELLAHGLTSNRVSGAWFLPVSVASGRQLARGIKSAANLGYTDRQIDAVVAVALTIRHI
jgi:hypothetical protein